VPPFEIPKKRYPHPTRNPQSAYNLVTEPPEHVIVAVEKDNSRRLDNDNSAAETNWYPGIAWTDWLMLRWIEDLPNASAQSRNLLSEIRIRRLYKRIAAYTRNGAHDILIKQLEDLDWSARVDICNKLHHVVCERLSREWACLNTHTNMTRTDYDVLCESHLLILIDIPNPSKKIGYRRPLGIVPELKEKSYKHDIRPAAEDKSWRDITQRMIEGIAPVRILCHPDVRNLVSAIYAPVETSMAAELSRLL
jgi:hypothetical protein